MLLARVEGNATAIRKHPSLQGWRLVLCQPVSSDGSPEGTPLIALDPYGAGMHQTVVVSSDGKAARQAVNDPLSPARFIITAIKDDAN